MNDTTRGIVDSLTSGEDPFYEYYLPVAGHWQENLQSAGQWMKALSPLTPERAQQALVERWSNARSPSLKQLIDVLLAYVPKAVVDIHGRFLLLCVRPETASRCNACYFLPDPLDRERVRHMLESRGIHNQSLCEFLSLFGGLRFWYSCGKFISPDDRVLQTDDVGFVDESEYQTWAGGIVIFHALNDDAVIINPAGQLAWIDHEQMTTRPLADSMEEFCKILELHLRNAWSEREWNGRTELRLDPFDSSGW